MTGARTARVAVLGAGLQGACAAMALAEAGLRVDLYDREPVALTQASARNEGKIHLGYVYGNDPSRRTAAAMVRGALAFEPLLRRWLGSALDRVPVSAPFHYAVERSSQLDVEEVAGHLRATHGFTEHLDTAPSYFGSDPRTPPRRLTAAECDELYDGRRVAAAFRTAEIAVDPEALAAVVRDRLAGDDRITPRFGTHVHGVERGHDGLTVRGQVEGAPTAERYDHVVNALWTDRMAVDRTVGLEPERAWLFRIKHYLRVTGVGRTLPCTTIVLGPFGDIVTYGDDAYLSWYPAGLRGSSSDIVPPAWPTVLGEHDAKEMWHAIHEGLVDLVPALADVTPGSVGSWRTHGGIIVAWGRSGIDDPASGLHDRFAIGLRTVGRYHSIDTGKLTMAPLFGRQVADRIREIGEGGGRD